MTQVLLGGSGRLSIVIFANGSAFDRLVMTESERCKGSPYNISRRVARDSAETALVNLTQQARGQVCKILTFSASNASLSDG